MFYFLYSSTYMDNTPILHYFWERLNKNSITSTTVSSGHSVTKTPEILILHLSNQPLNNWLVEKKLLESAYQ